MLTATESFLEGLEKWMSALRANDFEAAKRDANFFKMHAELLLIRPEFVRAFAKVCDGVPPRELIDNLSKLLVCLSEARQKALEQERNPRPPTSFG